MSLSENPALVALLTPASWLYAGAIRLRNHRYDRPGAAERVGVPVVSVGNLTVGGTGKTPLVGWLVRQLQQRGLRVAVVSRGYGGDAGRGPLVVSEGHGPMVSPARCGDEPYLLARTLPDALVIVGSDRAGSARAALRLGARVIVLDDGFQHRRLARDLDIVLLDGARPLGNRRLLPAGTLREPASQLSRANLIVATRCSSGESLRAIESEIRRHNASAPVLRAIDRARGFFDRRGAPVAAPTRAVAFCAIGRPAAFRHDLEAQGVELVSFHPFRDHHRFTPRELQELSRMAERHHAALVATEKDLARQAGEPWTAEPIALRIEPEIADEQVLIDALRSVMGEDGG